MRFPLVGGSYYAKSRIANAQRCINYYPEQNREDSPVPFTFYQRPGLRLATKGLEGGEVRLLYQSSNGIGYAIISNQVYKIEADFSITLLGTISTTSGQCRAIDNGGVVWIVDGSDTGWQIDMTTYEFSQVFDSTGTFQGANTVAILDTYMLWNMPNSVFFGSTLSNDLTFDALYFAGKVGYPDKLQGLIVNRHEIILLGSLKSEIWYNAGNTTFPFAQLPGAYIEHGTVSPYTISSIDIQTYWLGKDLEGQGVVFGLKGYDLRRISNFALENAIQKMPRIDDAFSYTYQQDGHYFYAITFPSGDQTWVYDSSLEKDPDFAWHQEAWTDGNGVLHRSRVNCVASIYGKLLGGDWENGNIYFLDPDYYLDDVNEEPGPITYIRGFPHLLQAPNPQTGQLTPTDFDRVQYIQFMLDMDCGNAPLHVDGLPARVGLRYSVDRGASFGETVLQSNGNPGQYQTVPTWQPIGIARDIVFEIEHSIAGPAALNGCFVKGKKLNT